MSQPEVINIILSAVIVSMLFVLYKLGAKIIDKNKYIESLEYDNSLCANEIKKLAEVNLSLEKTNELYYNENVFLKQQQLTGNGSNNEV